MTEQFRPQPENPKHNAPEAGSGPLGIPPPTPEQAPQSGDSKSPEPLPQQTTPQEQAKPEPESQAYPTPTPLNDFQSRQEQPRRDTISGGEVAKPLRELDDSRKNEKMPRITTSNVEQFLQSLEKQFNKSQEVTAPEQESQEIEESIRKLKALKTMSQRIDYLTDPPLEHLKKLWQHDPEFMRPILTGLVKRPARLEKKERLLYRITEGDMSPAGKPDYGRLMEMVTKKWSRVNHEDLMKLSQKDRDRLGEAEIDLHYAMTGIGEEGISELAGLQNALVCAHDFIRTFDEAGIKVPKVVTQVRRRLEKRRAYLDPDHSKDHPL